MAVDLTALALSTLRGVSTQREKLFAKLEVKNLDDLLRFFPRTYENRGDVRHVLDTPDGACASLILEVVTPLTSARIKSNATGRAMTVQHFTAADDTGAVHVTFFNAEYLKTTFLKGRSFRFYGIVKRTPKGVTMTSPEYESVTETASLPPFVPVYPLTAGLSQKMVASAVRQALDNYAADLAETLDAGILARNGLVCRAEALKAIHFPESAEALAAAKRRLAFEELYDFHLKTLLLGAKARGGRAWRVPYPDMRAFVAKLPFTLTDAQKHAIQDVLVDISSCHNPDEEKKTHPSAVAPARRLIQGDVGSGKTIVACAALYACALGGFQAALMAPTGILARQHYEEIGKLLGNFGVHTVLLVGGMKAKEKRETLALIESGEADVVIGTHALIEENVAFHKLALTVTDEQHRFGVMQRKALEDKTAASAVKPHTVVMSATPIPRTLALILYCDLDVSIIDTMPKGRIPVQTYAVGEDKRERVLAFIAKEIAAGRQAYIVCPLAEDSENVLTASAEMKSAKAYAESLARSPLSDARVAYIHGKMKQTEKDDIMARFASREIDVLVSTTVIEVGVNVPNATVMLVENAERFGLSQLHQLRGRVGRGSEKSYCILLSPFAGNASPDTDYAKRMDVLVKNTSGFAIAEKDLELRGPGEFFGLRQSGDFRFRIASATADMELVYLAKAEAERTVKEHKDVSADPLIS